MGKICDFRTSGKNPIRNDEDGSHDSREELHPTRPCLEKNTSQGVLSNHPRLGACEVLLELVPQEFAFAAIVHRLEEMHGTGPVIVMPVTADR